MTIAPSNPETEGGRRILVLCRICRTVPFITYQQLLWLQHNDGVHWRQMDSVCSSSVRFYFTCYLHLHLTSRVLYRVSKNKLHPTLIPYYSSFIQWTRMLFISLFTENISTYVWKVLAQHNEYVLRYCF